MVGVADLIFDAVRWEVGDGVDFEIEVVGEAIPAGGRVTPETAADLAKGCGDAPGSARHPVKERTPANNRGSRKMILIAIWCKPIAGS